MQGYFVSPFTQPFEQARLLSCPRDYRGDEFPEILPGLHFREVDGLFLGEFTYHPNQHFHVVWAPVLLGLPGLLHSRVTNQLLLYPFNGLPDDRIRIYICKLIRFSLEVSQVFLADLLTFGLTQRLNEILKALQFTLHALDEFCFVRLLNLSFDRIVFLLHQRRWPIVRD